MDDFLSYTLNSLKKAIEENFLEEKIFICPGFEIGNQILENLTRQGFNLLNIKAKTIRSLAEEAAETEIYEKKLKLISKLEVKFLIDNIFTTFAKEKRFEYFHKHTINTGIVNAISNIILELKYSVINSKNLKDDYFLNPYKANDLRLLYDNYNNTLEEKSLIDTADLINLAIKNLGAPDEKIKYIVFLRHNYSELEKSFINKLGGDNIIVIEDKPLPNLPKTENRLEAKNNNGLKNNNYNKFNWLFDIKNIPKDTGKTTLINIFSEASCYSEVHEIFQNLVSQKIPVDDTEIIYTSRELYLDTINILCEKLGIPVAFLEGIAGDKCRLGMALKGFLLWIKEDFLEIYLRRLIENNLIKTSTTGEGTNIANSNLAYKLRTSKIGWGRNRYKLIIKKRIFKLSDKLDSKGNNRQNILKNIEIYKSLERLSSKLLGLVPEINDGDIDLRKLCRGCIEFITNFLKSLNEEEAIFLKKLKDSLEILEVIGAGLIPLEEAVDKIIGLIKDTRFGKSSPKPGYLYVTNIDSGGISGRSNTFIAGMDDHKFPGSEIQDPILLDEERDKISDSMNSSKDKLKERLYDFTLMLAGLKGSVTFSYSTYDIKDDRNLFPSSLFLQIYRLKNNNDNLDYQDLFSYLGKSGGFNMNLSSSSFIDENGWWLEKLIEKGSLKNGRQFVLNVYPWLWKGDTAISCRKSSQLTVYDGLVIPEGSELDPRKNKDLVLSCSGIEHYAFCPFAFFLKYILKVERPEEIKRDYSKWLDEKDRGSLLHEVFRNFVETIKKLEKTDLKKQEEIINKILEEVLEKYIEEIPVPGEAIFNHEVNNLRRDLKVFLDVNNKELKNPCFLEFEFGYRGKDPIRICTGKDTYIYAAGVIDRVDISSEGEYQVWDYKGGGAFAYKADGYINGCKQVQHILYAKVMEEILKEENPDARVTACGYVLPTEKGMNYGKGCVFPRNPSSDEKWQEALNCLFELMGRGVFIMSEEENPPYFDDVDIYGTSEIKKSIKEKVKNPDNEVFELWRRLKEFK